MLSIVYISIAHQRGVALVLGLFSAVDDMLCDRDGGIGGCDRWWI